jgi:GxxExxY protein
MNFKALRLVNIPIIYDGIVFDKCLRLNVLVEDLVICGLKAVDKINPVCEASRNTPGLIHLKLTGKRLGFLINFNSLLIKNGVKRIIV